MVIARLQHGTGVAIKDVAIQLVGGAVSCDRGGWQAGNRGFIEKLPIRRMVGLFCSALTDKGIDAIEFVTPFTCMINDGLSTVLAGRTFDPGDVVDQFVSNADRTLATAVYKTDMASRERNTADYTQHKTMVGEAT